MGYLDGIKLRLQRQRDMTLKRPGFVAHLNCYRPWASEPNTKTGYTLYYKPAIDAFESKNKNHESGLLTIDSRGRILDMTQEVHYRPA